MEQPIEVSGRTAEEAIELALKQLGARRDEVEIEILSRGKPGFLGFGAELARVRLIRSSALESDEPAPPRRISSTVAPAAPRQQATPAAPQQPTITPQQRPASPGAPPQQPAALGAPPQRPAVFGAPQQPAATPADVAAAREALDRLMALMKVKAESSVGAAPDESPGTPLLQVAGEDAGLLIGRGGETLRALQLLTNLIATQGVPNRAHVMVDVERYRERRGEALRRLARRIGDRVAASGRPFTLEPMSAYERRLIHIALAEDPRVTTESVGEGEDRKVSVLPRQAQASAAPRVPRPGGPRFRQGGRFQSPRPAAPADGAPNDEQPSPSP